MPMPRIKWCCFIKTRFMNYLYILLLGLGITSSCSSKKAMVETDTSKLAKVIELTKTPCFGKCPVFTLKVYDNGLAVLEGRQNLKQIGLSHKVLTKKEMTALMAEFENGQLFSLKDEYRERVMDLPTTTLTYIKDGKKKVITGNMGFPKGFNDVVSACMELVQSEGWELKEPYNTK